MAPTFVGAAAHRGTTASQVNNPSGMQVGDLMLVAAFNNGTKTSAASYPAVVGPGWTQLAEATGDNDVIGYNFGARTSARVWWKLATEADLGGVTKVDSGNVLSIALAVYRSAKAATVTAGVSSVHGQTLTAPSVQLSGNGFQVCFFGATSGDGGSITVLTPGSPLTQRAATGSTNTHKAASLVADVAAVKGASGSKTATMDDPQGDWAWAAFSAAVVSTRRPVAPPARIFPRDDGLGVGGGRHFPPPKSQQRSGRRFGYY